MVAFALSSEVIFETLASERPGRGGYPPLRFFADNKKKTAALSAAKFAIAIQPTIWHLSPKKRWPDDPKGHASR